MQALAIDGVCMFAAKLPEIIPERCIVINFSFCSSVFLVISSEAPETHDLVHYCSIASVLRRGIIHDWSEEIARIQYGRGEARKFDSASG